MSSLNPCRVRSSLGLFRLFASRVRVDKIFQTNGLPTANKKVRMIRRNPKSVKVSRGISEVKKNLIEAGGDVATARDVNHCIGIFCMYIAIMLQ